MKNLITGIAVAVLCTAAATQLRAEGTNTAAAAGHRPALAGGPMSELTFEKMDANSDGKVTQDEFLAAWADVLKKRFTAMDANGDGAVTKEEMEKSRPAPMQRMHGGGKRGEGAPAGEKGGAAATGAPQK